MVQPVHYQWLQPKTSHRLHLADVWSVQDVDPPSSTILSSIHQVHRGSLDSRHSSVNKTLWKFTFMSFFAQSILFFVWISFNGGPASGFSHFPTLLKRRYRVDLGTSGTPALSNTSLLVCRGLRRTSFFLRACFRIFPLSECPLHSAGLMTNFFTVRWSQPNSFAISKLDTLLWSRSFILNISVSLKAPLRPYINLSRWNGQRITKMAAVCLLIRKLVWLKILDLSMY